MPAKWWDKPKIIKELQRLAKKLNTTILSGPEIEQVLARSTVHYYFGNLSNALEAAGLERIDGAVRPYARPTILSDDALFESLLALEVTLGHEPRYGEYCADGQYSPKPFARFGKWPEVLDKYRQWRDSRTSARA